MKLFDITYISLLNIPLTCKFTSRFQDGLGQKPTRNRQSFGGPKQTQENFRKSDVMKAKIDMIF